MGVEDESEPNGSESECQSSLLRLINSHVWEFNSVLDSRAVVIAMENPLPITL